MLADVGTTWYTWLEQGRDVRPSNEVLSALAAALRLDPTERRHLFVLHDRPVPERRPAGAERIDEPLRRMLDSLTGQAAFVLGRRWDVLAWNRAADVVFGPYARLEGDERNTLHLVFADPDHRRLLVDWEAVARASLAMFRADCARYAGDRDFERLITRLEPGVCAVVAAARGGAPTSGPKAYRPPDRRADAFRIFELGRGRPGGHEADRLHAP